MLLFIDSFDHYTIPSDVAKKWTSQDASGISALVAGRNGQAIRFTTSAVGWCLKGTPLRDTLIAGMAFRVAATANIVLMQFRDPGYAIANVCLTSAGAISLTLSTNNSGGNTVVATSATTPISAGNWYYIEAKFTMDDTNGYFEVKIDEVSVVDFTGDTSRQGASPYSQLGAVLIGGSILSFQSTRTLDIDDLYIADTLAGQVMDYVGDCRIACLYPNGEGNTQEWTAQGGGNHYDEVKEAKLDNDTTYEECTTYPKKTLYTFDDLTGVVGSVAAIQTVAATRKTQTGGAVYAHTVRSNGIDTDGDDKAFSAGSSYNYTTQIWEQDPSDSVDWTEARVNAVEAGVNRNA